MTDYVRVPREPTEAMIAAADCAGMAFAGSDLDSADMTRMIWSAMLAASPQGQAMTDKQRGAASATLWCLSIIFGSLALYTALTGVALSATFFTPVTVACAVLARNAWKGTSHD